MFKCLCKENVQDRLTGENYIAGKEYSFTKERAEEVTKTKYFEMVVETIEEVEEVKEEIVEEVVVEEKPKKTKKSAK